MERIKVAIERAKASRNEAAQPAQKGSSGKSKPAASMARHKPDHSDRIEAAHALPDPEIRKVPVDRARLEDLRIFSFDGKDVRSAHFDMLRTRVLQLMDAEGWRKIAITSPTPGCGKSVIALNLTLSIARLSDRSVSLIDLDLRKPQIANYLGMADLKGITNMLAGRCQLDEALVAPVLGNQKLAILAESRPVANSTELVASDSMKNLVKELSESNPKRILVFDLPPILSSDDMLAFLPQVDCVLVIAAVGQSTIDQVGKCERLIAQSNFLGVVLNKSSASDADHAEYY